MLSKIFKLFAVGTILLFAILLFFPFTNKISVDVPLGASSVKYMLGERNNIILEEFQDINTTSKVSALKVKMKTSRYLDHSSTLSFIADYEDNILINRLKNWFSLNSDADKLLAFAKEIRKNLISEISKFEFGEIYPSQIESSSCLCSRFEGQIDQKAAIMNSNIDQLSLVLKNEKKTSPLIIVHDLVFDTNQIDFSLCFRVSSAFIPSDSNPNIYFKDFDFTSLNRVSEFFGNYSLSHYNMFRILNLFDKNIIQENDILFVEEFLDNPFNGGDDKLWKSKVYFTSIN